LFRAAEAKSNEMNPESPRGAHGLSHASDKRLAGGSSGLQSSARLKSMSAGAWFKRREGRNVEGEGGEDDVWLNHRWRIVCLMHQSELDDRKDKFAKASTN